jgi:GH24 family phage-related lysozyme (muramidase)
MRKNARWVVNMNSINIQDDSLVKVARVILESPQLDEGFKEVLFALFSLGASMYEVDYVMDLLDKQRVPVTQQVDLVQQLQHQVKDAKFTSTAKKVIGKLQQQEVGASSKSQVLKQARSHILPNEVFGRNIENAKNDRFMTPYRDDVGLWTVGVGHLIGNGSDAAKAAWVKDRVTSKKSTTLSRAEALQMFDTDLEKHYKRANTIFKGVWDGLSLPLKVALVDISYRGDLDKVGAKDFDFVTSIKKGMFKTAAKQYLDHSEYKKRSSIKTDGVVKRMQANANLIANG